MLPVEIRGFKSIFFVIIDIFIRLESHAVDGWVTNKIKETNTNLDLAPNGQIRISRRRWVGYE